MLGIQPKAASWRLRDSHFILATEDAEARRNGDTVKPETPMGILSDLVATAVRYDKWRQVQEMEKSAAVEAQMQAARVNFSGSRYMPLDEQVFFEEIVEDDDLMPIRYFEMGRLAARPVGRIHLDLGPKVGEGYATGFLVAPGVLLTNWHVFKSASIATAATVSFDAEDDVRGMPAVAKVFRLRPQDLFVSDEDLDFAFVAVEPVAIDGATPIQSFGFLRLFPQTGKIVRDEYATIVQHPRGRQKHVAVRNNKVVVYVYDAESEAPDNNYLYYSTDTLEGSSGSPVFSDQFFVVALHRRGVPDTKLVDGKPVVLRKTGGVARQGDPVSLIKYVANEGVRVSCILKRVEALSTADPKIEAARHVILSVAGDEADGPFSVPVAPMVRTQNVLIADQDFLEITRRKVAAFADAKGYNERWLAGFEVGLPAPSDALLAELAPRTDGVDDHVLPFRHFSTAVHARRRMPVYAAVNIDGKSKAGMGSMPTRPQWSYDPRISDEHQMDDSLFSSMLQRGHMAARDFVYWGADFAAADLHSFTLSNVCPQIGAFNMNREWSKLERNIITLATGLKQHVTVFMGPILDRRDPLYDALRSENSDANVGTGIRLPKRFWYIVMWVKLGQLQIRPYLLDQGDDIAEAGELEIDLVRPEKVLDTTLAEITRLTRLSFPGLESHQ
ncbi:MAG TPA: DNA/RNA non-specific endonuclease [Burkholderiaceae bacterium]|nr:DNA/RNA non-specific endonuclease [Burkholderiaceae bacterium]